MIQYLYQTEYITDTESERNTNWPQYSRVRCLDTGKTYILVGTSWVDYVTKAAVEAVLTGAISSHSHSGGSASWGGIGGTLSAQTDLQNALNAKQATLTRNTGAVIHANLANGTLAMAFGTNSSVKVTPTATGTFTTTVPAAGCECFLQILTSGTTSRTITFGTGFKSTGTLATGTVTGKVFTLTFISDGTTCNQIARSTAM